jgi:hypothetical protein
MNNEIRSIATNPFYSSQYPLQLFLGGHCMNLSKMFRDTVGFFSDAVSRVFGLDDDNYPPTGVQPFTGDVADKKHRHE